MTDIEAEDMLTKLRVHYGEPVRPLSHFCKAIEAWGEAIWVHNRRPNKQRGPHDDKDGRHGAAYYDHLGHIFTDIRKSALLYRMLYLGQPKRTIECPKHLGTLDMGEWIGGATREPVCPHGCGGTGWLP